MNVSVEVHAPFAGVVHFNLAAGENVAAGDVIAVVEAVKLEAPVVSPCAGTVTALGARDFENVDGGQLLVSIAAAEESAVEDAEEQ